MKTIKGDLLQLAKSGMFDVIAHGCNCQHNFGAGIAKGMAIHFPESEKTDKETHNPQLGEISIAFDLKHNLNIVNCYTQVSYGKAFEDNPRNYFEHDTKKARYQAIKSCFQKINEEFAGMRLGIPLIGCGLAGLSWKTVERYVEDELTDVDVTIVKLPKKSYDKAKKRR